MSETGMSEAGMSEAGMSDPKPYSASGAHARERYLRCV